MHSTPTRPHTIRPHTIPPCNQVPPPPTSSTNLSSITSAASDPPTIPYVHIRPHLLILEVVLSSLIGYRLSRLSTFHPSTPGSSDALPPPDRSKGRNEAKTPDKMLQQLSDCAVSTYESTPISTPLSLLYGLHPGSHRTQHMYFPTVSGLEDWSMEDVRAVDVDSSIHRFIGISSLSAP